MTARVLTIEGFRLGRGMTDLDASFQEFHQANPQVYERLRALALEVRRRGIQRVGIRMLWERLRWDLTLETSGEPYKLNDHLTARYARALMQEPGLAGLFETRDAPANPRLVAPAAPALSGCSCPALVEPDGQLAMW